MDSSAVYSHTRTRTTSSSAFPPAGAAAIQSPTPMHHLSHINPNSHHHQHNRRSPSVNTFSTTSSVPPPPAAYRTSPTNDLRRSISSRSGGSSQPTGYVALLRKQKATVWCDRAQYEDPRLVAQQRAAKMRATLEVIGGQQRTASGLSASAARTNTGISATGKVAAKIRHHGKPAVVGYAPGDHHVGVGGVPMRLSATEVEAESSEDDDPRLHHRRTGSSGRSSTASRRGLGYRSSGGGGGGGGPSRRWSPTDTPERSRSLVEETPGGGGDPTLGDAASGRAMTAGSGSSSSGERADNLGELGNKTARLASNSLMHSTVTREKSVKGADDLRRRGSVDERTTTLTGGRLYIANPD
ncbi:hypothetical protein LY76DRAFT_521160 [Colletotrichum caudatum]|nr:hypothetical protein LY76DRAFT_521160 [Colletotrichum caudatum]